MQSWRQNVLRFLFPHESDRWLGILRIGLGLQIVAYTLALRDDWGYLLAATGRGLIGRDLAEISLSAESSFVPRLGWLVQLGRQVGLHEQFILSLVWFALLGLGVLLAFGLFSRFAAVLTWLVHLAAVKSGDFLSYGVDTFTTIGLFYLMLSPLPDHFSLDYQWGSRPVCNPQLLGFWRRVLQLHLCLIYLFSGIAKSLGGGWWNGANVWRALIRPPFNLVPPESLLFWKHLFPVMGISVCIIEAGYAIFIWGRKTRPTWLLCVILMHLGIGVAMGMYLFASVMIILNIAAFGPGMLARKPEPRARETGKPVTVQLS